MVIDRGSKNGVKPGHVLGLYHASRVKNKQGGLFKKQFKSPREYLGEVLVVHPFERVSYGLVVHTNQAAQKFDEVTNRGVNHGFIGWY